MPFDLFISDTKLERIQKETDARREARKKVEEDRIAAYRATPEGQLEIIAFNVEKFTYSLSSPIINTKELNCIKDIHTHLRYLEAKEWSHYFYKKYFLKINQLHQQLTQLKLHAEKLTNQIQELTVSSIPAFPVNTNMRDNLDSKYKVNKLPTAILMHIFLFLDVKSIAIGGWVCVSLLHYNKNRINNQKVIELHPRQRDVNAIFYKVPLKLMFISKKYNLIFQPDHLPDAKDQILKTKKAISPLTLGQLNHILLRYLPHRNKNNKTISENIAKLQHEISNELKQVINGQDNSPKCTIL